MRILPAASDRQRQKRDFFEYHGEEDDRQPIMGELPSHAIVLLAREQQNGRDGADIPSHIPRPMLNALVTVADQQGEYEMHDKVDAVGEVHSRYASAITSIS